ncbi:hypothetical protein DXG01_005562 [Tephrocybe rancida]|nr:hypothetical protein DXG01_005562 [Tephrocybe rancida]
MSQEDKKSPEAATTGVDTFTAPELHKEDRSIDLGRQQTASLGSSESAAPNAELEKGHDDSDWENDPSNARNWALGRKWTATAIVSMYAFISPLASSMMAPGLPEIAHKYNITNSTVLAMTLSIFLLSFAFGLFNICNVLSIGFNLGCAYAPTAGSLIGFRFLGTASHVSPSLQLTCSVVAGLTGSAPIACGGGSISDLFSERDRASAMALFTLGPLIGPAVGPIAGGFIAQTVGIKWVFVVIAVVCGVTSLFGIPLLRETYAPVLRYRKAVASGDPARIAKAHSALVRGTEGRLAFMWMSFSRPLTIFFTSLTCFILSLYLAFMAGIYYLMFVTFSSFFAETYGFGPGIGGLTYLGLGIGFFIAAFAGAKFADKVYKHLAEKRGGKGTPEMRMPALFIGSFFVPIGLLLPILLYLVDAFEYAASATAAAYVLRSLLGFVFPLFGKQMFDRLGLGGGNSLLAGLAIILGIPFPVWIYYRGEAIRQKEAFLMSGLHAMTSLPGSLSLRGDNVDLSLGRKKMFQEDKKSPAAATTGVDTFTAPELHKEDRSIELGRQQTASLGSSESAAPNAELEKGLDDSEWENDPTNARLDVRLHLASRKLDDGAWTATDRPKVQHHELNGARNDPERFPACLCVWGFSLGCAYAPTAGSLIGFRFLGTVSHVSPSAILQLTSSVVAGLTGSAPNACGGGSISDIFSERDRASAMALFTLGPLMGPAVGPIAGGFIAQAVGIKWVFVVIAAVCAVASLLGIPFLRETYAPVLRYRKAIASGDPARIAKTHSALVKGTEGRLAFMWMSFSRPLTILFTSLTCLVLSLYLAFMAGIYYLMFVTFASFFGATYGFGPGIGGLTYLGLGIGFFIATIVGAKFADKMYKHLAEKRGGKGTPEMRMPALFIGSFFVPIGLFWYGWSAQAKLHWIMPILGSGIFGFGIMTTTFFVLLYLVDAFEYAASATAATYVLRSLLGFVFPLFGKQMFHRLGLGGGNSLLAGLAIILGIPFPVWIYYRGEAIRQKSNKQF